MAAQRHALKNGDLPCTVGIGFTASYPDHPQLGQLAITDSSGRKDIEQAAATWLGWLAVYANRPDLFDHVEVIPFLDHGWAPHDEDVYLMGQRWFQEAVGIIMFDASSFELEENIRRTADYVRTTKARVVVEACPDKVYERIALTEKNLVGRDLLSRPEDVERFVRETGVDLVVPNLGTEHRSVSSEPLEYQRKIARAIARRVGPIQALHGSSSLGDRLAGVGRDGICKVNYYTAMARQATHALERAWHPNDAGRLRPISQACGSFIHRTRRDAIAGNIEAMLLLLSKS